MNQDLTVTVYITHLQMYNNYLDHLMYTYQNKNIWIEKSEQIMNMQIRQIWSSMFANNLANIY